MGTTSEKLQIIVEFNDNGTVKGVRQIGTEIDKAGKTGKTSFAGVGKNLDEMNQHTRTSISLFGKLAAAVSVAGIGYGMKKVAEDTISAGAAFDKMKLSLDSVTQGNGDEWFEKLNDWAMKMPVNTEKAIQSFIMMRAMGLQPTIDDMTTIVDTMAALGGDAEVMEGIARALGQIQSKGKASAEELMQLAERGVPATEILREKLGLTAEQVANIGNEAISGSVAVRALLDGMAERFGGLSSKINEKWSGLMESLKAYWTDFQRLIMDSGVMATLESALGNLVKKLDEMRTSGSLAQMADEIGSKLVESIQKVTRAVKDGIQYWKNNGDEIMTVAGYIGKATIEYGKFWVIAKTISGGYVLVKFFKDAKVAIWETAGATTALNAAMKANLLALGAYAGYKLGKFLTAASTGTIGIEGDIEEETSRAARYADRLRKAEVEAMKKQTSGEQVSQEMDAWVDGINKKIKDEKDAAEKAQKAKVEAYKTMYKSLGMLNKEYYDLLKKDIETERDKFIQATNDKALAQQWFSSEIAKLDADFNKPTIDKAKQVIDAATAEKEALTKRLEEYRSFYGELQTMIKENAALEKQHIAELNALYKQQSDIRLSTETMIRQLKETQMNPVQRYESQRSGLNQQYASAMQLSGQEQIQALEQYKQAVGALASQYSEGIKSQSSGYGMGGDRFAVSSREIVDAAISDIQRAAAAQQSALQELEAEKQRQIDADRKWGEQLKTTAREVADEIISLESDIETLGTMIDQLSKYISIDADISMAEQEIRMLENEINAMRARVSQPIKIKVQYEVSTVPAAGSGAKVEGSRAVGTQSIPKTGLYWMHQGEEVKTKSEVQKESATSKGAMSFGDINIYVPANAAAQSPSDWRNITRQYIVPELQKIGRA